jgi:glycosyltransferase involved in cell wall biosynthesis
MINHSGIGTYIKSLIPYFSEKYDVTLLGSPLELVHFNVKRVILLKSKIYSITEQLELFLKVPKCDIFWSPHYNIPLLSLKAKNRVVTIHDVFHLAYLKDLPYKQQIYARVIINSAVKKSDQIITVSNFSKNEIIKYTNTKAGKIQVIYNGVQTGEPIEDSSEVRKHYDLPNQYILFVGNVKPHKNLRSLLSAYLLLSPGLRSIYKIAIAGKKDGFITGDHELIDWVSSNKELKDNVVFTGFVEEKDMPFIYSKASLLVFPSFYEGFGLPPLEAMARHCPVITSDAASMPEICGDAALFFSPSNETDLKAKITQMLTDKELRDQFIKKGIDRIKLFKWENSAEQHIKLFNKLIEN